MSNSENQQAILFTADNIFKRYDKNFNEKLDQHEVEQLFHDAFQEMGVKDKVSHDRVKLFISRIDKDGDNKISKKELEAALKRIKKK